MAVQKLDAIDGMNQRQNRHFFTSYPEMNEVLNRFAAEADANEIWISAEVQELRENRSGNQLCQIVGMALDTAKRNCIETTPPRGRYIRIRCRDMQEQTLIKIQYSCEDRMPVSYTHLDVYKRQPLRCRCRKGFSRMAELFLWRPQEN